MRETLLHENSSIEKERIFQSFRVCVCSSSSEEISKDLPRSPFNCWTLLFSWFHLPVSNEDASTTHDCREEARKKWRRFPRCTGNEPRYYRANLPHSSRGRHAANAAVRREGEHPPENLSQSRLQPRAFYRLEYCLERQLRSSLTQTPLILANVSTLSTLFTPVDFLKFRAACSAIN